jgi:hypothetical protein
MKRNSRTVLFCLATFLVGAYVGFWFKGQIAVDACLDAGGAWQSAGQYCVGIAPD